MEYKEFIKEKRKDRVDSGFDINIDLLNKNEFDFQKFIVNWALKKGRAAIFAECGLGKTIMQLDWADQVVKKTNKPVLILAPLAVSGQTIKEGEKFGISIKKIGCSYDIPGIYIINYEQLENINTDIFSGIVLDESSILKNFTGKYKQLIIDRFNKTPYKLACTATPSPNDPMELGNHAEFLNVMSFHQMLAMYFVHDAGNTQKWRLKKHGINKFWKWVSSWGIMFNNPSDIGFDGSDFMLPKLNLINEQIKTPKKDNGMLFNDTAINAIGYNQELRDTKELRLNRVAEIVNNSNEKFIIWIKQNEEGDYLRKIISDATEVKGSDNPEYKEDKLLGFANGDFRVLLTKTKIAQFGLNYQNCHNQIFASLDFSFEGTYQSMRRSYRFGQKNEVNIYLITTDTMANVKSIFNKKQKQFKEMQQMMVNNIDLNIIVNDDKDIDNEIIKKDNYTLMRGDCVDRIKEVENDSVHFSIFSPPFAELYTYSDHNEDMGNSKNYKEFFKHFEFMAKDLYRIMKSGRNIAIHCMDLPIQKGKEGYIGLRDFSGMLIDMFNSLGFIYHSRVTIWKDPVVEMQRTKALGLLHKQVKKDSTMSRVGIPDYLLVFRKNGENLEPVTNTELPVDLWQKYASPVWMDIKYGDTLQFRSARDNKDEKHIAPLQLQTIERAIHLWTNKGDTVFTPFMGIGSEVYQALKMDRKGIGIELKESYFNAAKTNIEKGELENAQTEMF